MNRQDYYEANEDFLERMWKQPKNVLNLIVIAANILIFLLVSVTGGTDDMENMIRWGAAYTPLIRQGETYRLFTCMFLHFGIQHLFSNMLLLLFVGDYLERIAGKVTYFAVYFLGGLTGSVCSYRYELNRGESVVSAGASGAVFAVLGAIVILMILNRGHLEDLSLKRLAVMIVLTLVVGFQSSNVDNFAHIGGFVGGAVVMLLLSPFYLTKKKTKA